MEPKLEPLEQLAGRLTDAIYACEAAIAEAKAANDKANKASSKVANSKIAAMNAKKALLERLPDGV